MVRRIFVLALLFALLADRSRAQDVALESRPARWRLTYDSFDESSSKNLGLVGIHFDLLSPFDEAPGVYTGLGGYAAVIGTSGGLFVGGATVGYLREIYDGYSLDFGLFAGGGGGGDADVGSGLMLRPHVGLEYALGLYAVRIELARVDFPDGDIDDTFISIGVGLPTEILTAAPGRRAGRIPDEAVIRRPLRVTPTVMHLDPDSGQKLKNGAPLDDEIQLMGIELDYFLNRSLYGAVEAYGAGGGGVAGFAMGLVGLGLSKPLLGNLATLELKVSAGAGGGGEVDTGGGFLWQATGGVNARINDTLGLQIMVGRLLAPDGDFDSTAFQAGISWSSMPAELRLDYPRSRLRKEGLSSDAVQLDTTRLQLLHKTYLPKSSAKKSNGSDYDDNLNLLGIGAEKPFLDVLAVTGRAFAAYDGDIGGYAEGLAGVKYEFHLIQGDPKHVLTAHAEVGVGGGGGVDIGSGLLYELTAGYRYQLSPLFAITVEAGGVNADKGSFEAQVFQLGINWSMQRAVLR